MNVLNVAIETERLFLRGLTMADATDMFEYTSNRLVTKHLSWKPHTIISETERFIQNAINKKETDSSEFVYGLELKSEKKLIGTLKISNVCFHNKRGQFTSILNPAYQGKGYMGEAWNGLLKFCFENLHLQRIQSYVTEENTASQKKNDKAGLKYEGRLKKFWTMKGVSKNALVYGITDDIYFKIQKSNVNK